LTIGKKRPKRERWEISLKAQKEQGKCCRRLMTSFDATHSETDLLVRGLRSELVVCCTQDLIDPPAAEPAVPLVSVWSAERQDETATISSIQYTGVWSIAINVASEDSISVAADNAGKLYSREGTAQRDLKVSCLPWLQAGMGKGAHAPPGNVVVFLCIR